MKVTQDIKVKKHKDSVWREVVKYKGLYLIFLPTLLWYLIFMYVPMFGNIIAFQKYSITKGFLASKFVGFENFIDFFNNYKFFELLRNTITITGLNLLIGFPLPIILALLLNEVKSLRYKKTIQTVTYLPYFISSVVMVSMLMLFVSGDGIFNKIRMSMGLETISFMTTPEYFPWIYVLSNIWQNLGWNSIIYIAAIAGVDQELYEAAQIDGAGRWKQTLHITLPGISSTIIILLIMQIGQMLTVGYEKIILMYNPSIYSTADVISTYVYRKGLIESDYSYSTAVSLFNSVCNFILLMSANGISKKISGEGLW